MLANLVSEDIYHIFSWATTASSCLFNIYLVYILLITKVNQVGAYRWLLLSFAVADVVISVVHFATIPAVHMTEFGYVFWAYRFLHLPTSYGVFVATLWAVLFYQTFLLLAYHYFYRFVILCSPTWIAPIQRNPWRNWLSLAFIIYILVCGSVAFIVYLGWRPSDLSRDAFGPQLLEVYGVDLFEPGRAGHMGIIYWISPFYVINEAGEKEWQWGSVKYIVGFIILHTICGSVIISCLVEIVRAMSPKGFSMSVQTRHIQRQLFRALLWQTLFPTITSYIPIAFIFLIPLLTQYPCGGLGTIALMASQLFPIIDPFLVVFFIQGYQSALPKIVRKLLLPSKTSSAVLEIATTQFTATSIANPEHSQSL